MKKLILWSVCSYLILSFGSSLAQIQKPSVRSVNILEIELSLAGFIIDDFFAGNNDGVANGGEVMDVIAIVANDGTEDAFDVVATLSSASEDVFIIANQAFFGTVSPAESNEAFGWFMEIAQGTEGGTVIDFDVTITADNGEPLAEGENLFFDSFSMTTGPPIPAATGPFVLESVSVDDMAPSA